MIGSLARAWFGDFTKEELKKFVFLAFIFAFTIGVYWLLRPAKDGVLRHVVGMANQPFAKWLSLVVVFPLVMFYSFLVDKFRRERIFYALSAIYALAAVAFSIYFYFRWNTFQTSAWNFSGWMFYVYVESFGSLMVALFWAFAADITTPESAKKGYPLLMMGAQTGALIGSLAVVKYAKTLGTSTIVAFAAVGIAMVGVMVRVFMAVVPADQLVGYQAKEKKETGKKKPKVGFGEGLRLMLSQPYLLGIFAVISIYEVVVTIFDFRFKMLASSAIADSNALTSYLGGYGAWVSIVALVSLLLGIGNIGRKLGLTFSLVLLPIIIGVEVFILNYSLSLGVAFWIMVLSKALNYALNQPAKEQLYIPTSRDAKYKSKAWIEMFGSRSSKAMGSGINALNKLLSQNAFIALSMVASLGLCGVWFLVALYLGKTNKKAIDENQVVC